MFLAVQVVGVSIMLLFLMGNFRSFIFFATSMGLIAGPAIAYYNYRAISGSDIAAEYRPGRALVAWNWVGIVILAAFAVAFLWNSIS
jgi:hypothetical protein